VLGKHRRFAPLVPKLSHLLRRKVRAAHIEDQAPNGLAHLGGAVVESLWALQDRFMPAGARDDPPLTRFLVEQLSTAHWFDQRLTREILRWRPRVSLDEGFAELERWYAARSLR